MNHSNRIVLVVVVFIGLNSTLLCGGLLYLTWSKITVDAALIGLAGTALGSLGTLLATTRGSSSEKPGDHAPAGTPADPVAITNAPGDKLEVTTEEQG